MKKIYLDYAASTPIAPEVLEIMLPYFTSLPTDNFGNPGSLHYFGQKAIAALDNSREIIAKSIGANFNEVIFTSSATEANNLALKGVFYALKSPKFKPRLIVSSIEHDSILETSKTLEKDGFEVIYLPVNSMGFINLDDLKNSLNEAAVLISIMTANNETGAIQPIKKIAKIINDFKKQKNKQSSIYPLFHTDAVQAFQFLDHNINEFNIDLMTLSSHKIYGAKGAAMLYIKNSIIQNNLINPIIAGGEQEFGLRAGTENIPSITGFAKAIELVEKNRKKEYIHQFQLMQYFYKNLKKIYPLAKINGPELEKFKLSERLPNILNIYFPDINAESFLTKLDLLGIAASAASACKARATKPSHVLKAMGFEQKRQKNSVRFSIGKFTTKKELDETLKTIKSMLKQQNNKN